MRPIPLVLAALLMAPASLAEDGPETRACLERIVTVDDFRSQCIGVVTEVCHRNADLRHHRLMFDCLEAEHFAWDRLLNEIYKEVRAELPENEREPLKAAQNGWIQDRDATCTMEGLMGVRYRDETGLEAAARCHRDMTAERVIRLWRWRNGLRDD